jgi:hydrogenase maturation protease
MSEKKILILGIGNLLMGDEGLGVHFINEYSKNTHPSNVELLEGGTGGFHLLSYLQDYPITIIIDAAFDDYPEGTIRLIKPKFASDFPPSLSSHDIGLKDLMDSLFLLGKEPVIYLFTVSISQITPMVVELTDPIKKVIDQLVGHVNVLVNQISTSDKIAVSN